MSGESGFPPQEGDRTVNQKLQLTMEEILVLRQCNKESFWYRSLPLALTFMTGTHLAVSRGMLVGHAKYGPLFKNLAAGFIGYLVGKVSYQGKCREKLLQLENSPLADALRKARDNARNPRFNQTEVSDSIEQSSPAPSFSTISDTRDNSNIDLDSSSNKITEIDVSYRQNLEDDNSMNQNDEILNKRRESDQTDPYAHRRRNREEPSNYNTRLQRNREESMSKPSDQPPRPNFSPQQPITRPAPARSPVSNQTQKNQYGDVWDD